MSPNILKISTKCRHILDLNNEEKQQFLDSFDIALSDCDGVIWHLSGPIPYTGEAINLLQEAGKPFKYLSNNGMRTDKDYEEKIKKIGVKYVTNHDTITPVKVVGKYIKTHFPQEICYSMSSSAFNESLSEMGVQIKDMSRRGFIRMEEFHKAIRAPQDAKVAVMDVNLYQTYAEYTLAHQFLVKQDCELFITATDTVGPFGEEMIAIGPGVFVNALIAVSEKKPIFCGKPSKLMADYMIERYQIRDHSRALFIGDNLTIDVKYATSHGFQSLFVLSGANTKEEMFDLSVVEQPDYYADSLGDFVEFFNAMNV